MVSLATYNADSAVCTTILAATAGPTNGQTNYYCQFYSNSSYLLYSAGTKDINVRIDNINSLVPLPLTNVTVWARNNVIVEGEFQYGLSGFNAMNSTGNVLVDIAYKLPSSAQYIRTGSGADAVVLASGWKDIPNLYVNCGAGLDIVGMDDIDALYYSQNTIYGCELIGLSGQATISHDVGNNGFLVNNPGYIGHAILTPLQGALTFTNVPLTANYLKLYASPGQAITIPTITSLYLYLTDELNNVKGPITITGGSTLTVAAVTTLYVHSYGSNSTTLATANTISSALTAASLTRINVYGNKPVAVDVTNCASLTTVDASFKISGGVYFSNLNGAVVTSVIGSAFNDSMKFQSGSFVSTVVIDGGAGTGDILSVITTGELTAAKLANSRNFEILDLGLSAAATYGSSNEFQNFCAYNPSCFGIAINRAIGGNLILTNVPDNLDNLIIGATLASSVTFTYVASNLNGALTLVLDDSNGPSAAGVTMSSFIATGLGSLSVISQGSSANTLTALTLTALQDLFISGTKALTITSIGAAGVIFNVDAQNMSPSASLTLTTIYSGTTPLVLQGSPGADTFYLNSAATARYSVIGLGGADTFDKTIAASTTGIVLYIYKTENDGGSKYGIAVTGATSLSRGGDTITDSSGATGKAFVSGQDKIVIDGTLKSSVLLSQSGLFAYSGAPAVASTLNFNLDTTGIVFYAGATTSYATASNAAAILLATLTAAITTVSNEVIGYRRILVLQDTATTGFSVYSFKSVAADNAITANEVLHLVTVTTGDAGNVAYTDFEFA